ncbi:gb [Venturia nashicola]|uniref:Gb n=1 Tax=Venturia nashicola TaxID=86259 RepID=A0A4Z1NXU1_9PEZI|nr:gb [Venturia nashicola]TLD23506.1 gb [Venturia nashicola]
MKFSTSIPIFLAAFASAAPVEPSSKDEPTPSPSGVFVKDIKYNGSGCPTGSVATQFSDNRKILTVVFNKYEANIGPKVLLRSDARKNCQLNLKLNYPSGFQYSVVGFITRGYADIDVGVTAEIGSIYYFSGQPQQLQSRNKIEGPFHASYTKEDTVDVATAVWSPCDAQGLANINTDIRLVSQNSTSAGSLTVDSIDGKFETQFEYKLQWRFGQCGTTNRAADTPPIFNKINVKNNNLVVDI